MTALAVLADWSGRTADVALLGPRERAATAVMPEWRARQWAIGRLTAKKALRLLGRSAVEILTDVATGAPMVSGLSLSHTADRVACLVVGVDMSVGIDVEGVDDRNAKLVPRIRAAGEPADLDPTTLWAIKEAALKACGGKPGDLRSYAVHSTVTSVSIGSLRLAVWTRRWNCDIVAIAGENLPEPRFIILDPSTLLEL